MKKHCRQVNGKMVFMMAFLFYIFSMAAESNKVYHQSNSHINRLLQDHIGYIWIATDNGLTRYDGHTFKTFTRNSESPALLSNTVLSLYEDSDQNLWVGTYDGIQRYNPETETFVTPALTGAGMQEATYINSIIEDKDKNIWFSTSRSGVICLTDSLKTAVSFNTTNSSICSDRINVLFEDKFGNIWIGTNDNGVSVYNPVNKSFTHYDHNPADDTTLSGNMIFSFAQSKDGELFVASVDGGIDSFNYRTHKFTRNRIPIGKNAFVLKNDEANNRIIIGTDGKGLYSFDLGTNTLTQEIPDIKEFDVVNSKVHDIIIDNNDNIWAGVYQKGLLYLSNSGDKIENLRFNPFNATSNIGNYPVLSILKDREGKLWVGTDGDGIYHTDNQNRFQHISPAELDSHIVQYLYEASDGRIWMSTYLGGLSKYNASAGRFEHVDISIDSKPLTDIMYITEDSEGNLWLGTNNNGVVIYNPETRSFKNLIHKNELPDKSLPGNSIQTIFIDSNGKVWIGTSDSGLTRYDPSAGTFEHFNLINRKLNNNCIYAIEEDHNGKIWVATALGVSYLTDRGFKELKGWTEKDMEPAYSMVLDNDGDIWYATNEGLKSVDVNKAEISQVLSQSKLGHIEFKKGASFIDDQGVIYFGGVGGLVYFHPDGIVPASKMDDIVFQYLMIEKGEGNNPQSERMPIVGKESIELKYGENNITVTFTAFEFDNEENLTYQAKLENYDQAWVSLAQGSHSVSYSKLPPGSYTLKIRALDPEGNFSEKSLKIKINPPFYLTWYAKVIYIILFLAFIIGAFLWYKNMVNRRGEIIKKKQEDINNQDKLQFFTDISHEVRTPLTLIMSPISSLKKATSDKKLLSTYNIMEANGQRILRMLDQVIDLRKIETNNSKLKVVSTDLRQFLETVSLPFSHLIESHGIIFGIQISEEVPKEVLLDRDKIEKIVFNLLANAIRFTPDGGKITIKADIDGTNYLRIRIYDSGPGIPKDDQERIFERFFQGKNAKKTGGTGIGLHLSRKMIDLHHGRIFVEESSDAGTCFTVVFPIDKNSYQPFEIDETGAGDYNIQQMAPIETDIYNQVQFTPMNKSFTVLIAEDDESIQKYLQKTLSSDYNVITAGNGIEGLELVMKHRPNCVLTDIMMPEMDGLEFCRKIRSNQDICTIPVIMVSARSDESQKIEGIEAGADVYITKPFNLDILKAHIDRLIHSQRVFRQKITKSEKVNQEIAELKTADEKLLSRVEDVVVSELANPELNVEFIARKIGVSRSHLHRKLRELLKINPSLYIRKTRMRHAAILLTEKEMTISEVAYATGFNSLSHFSSSFKEFYGLSPTQYIAVKGFGDNSETFGDNS